MKPHKFHKRPSLESWKTGTQWAIPLLINTINNFFRAVGDERFHDRRDSPRTENYTAQTLPLALTRNAPAPMRGFSFGFGTTAREWASTFELPASGQEPTSGREAPGREAPGRTTGAALPWSRKHDYGNQRPENL